MTDLAALASLVERCAAADGASPVNDQAMLETRRGERAIVDLDGSGVAIAVVATGEQAGDAPAEVELAVDPDRRGAGLGARLAERVATEHPGFEAWAHGDLPASRALAASLGMQRIRTLLQLRAPVPADAVVDARLRPFAESDADAWVAVNAAAFASHPEQGRLTARDLADRRAEAWHDDANLLVAPGTDGLDGYAWIKPDGDVAELYALGVAPHAQGTGLGGVLMRATFARMHALGFATAHLYVEGDNAPALGLYRSRGFVDHARDVRWRHIP
ncbi:mycothiol synthase [Agrococcus jejuensis]|uniref:mycothiol synthase n=1 Tax=Agrococcus jejuensis TaxID=399736 RepID=UPI0011A57246|nr:mycothiol synthase [Agrococcus jejuensis]